jgi:hypothetical protein
MMGGWYYHGFVFTSALVLIAAHFCPFTEASLSSESMEVSWLQCMFILEFFGRWTPAFKLTAQFLQALKHAVWQTFPQAVGNASRNVEEGE